MSLVTILLLCLTIIDPLIKTGIATTIIPNHASGGSNETDLEALLAFNSKITQDPKGALRSWNKSIDFCQWQGVVCDGRHKRVTALSLPDKHLVGTLSPFIGNLSFLQQLDLFNNSLSGHIPPEVSRLLRLQTLTLINNEFDGEIPENISQCLQLNILKLGNNKLVGRIPPELGSLTSLRVLDLDYNNLTGEVSSIANLTSLQELYLSGQFYQGVGFNGEIPEFIGTFRNLTVLALGGNSFSGAIPQSLYNLSNLQIFSLDVNLLQGSLPPELGSYFPQLQWFQIGFNYLTGQIPVSLSNLSSLEVLDISNNNFTGKFLFDASNMANLSTLSINIAGLGTGEPDDLKFLDTLVNCSSLQLLQINDNLFGGTLSPSIANLSTNLQVFEVSSNQISGHLPSGFGNLFNLQILDFRNNRFTGTIPADITEVSGLQKLDFSNNQLSGTIPSSLGNLSMLSILYMASNKLQGKIPASLGGLQSLQSLDVGQNNLIGTIPHELFQASALLEMHVDFNNLEGSLPSDIGTANNIFLLVMNNNNFSGEIPSSLGQYVSLTGLYLQQNSLTGHIPQSFNLLKDLHALDLSRNKLSGQVPSYFSGFSSLVSLDLSYNNFEGEVPTEGIFRNVSGLSLVGNNKLCGGIPQIHLPRCRVTDQSHQTKGKKRLSRSLVIVISISCVLLGIAIALSTLHFFCSRRRTKDLSSGSLFKEPFLKVSYDMLRKATNEFSAANLIGAGSFGSVYRGTILRDGVEEEVAIKVVRNQHRGANKSFITECEALRAIRHRNLVRIITACSSIDFQRNDFRALVYEFMPNGSLERWIHSASEDRQMQNLSLQQRLNIAMDVACALDYIHNDCNPPILHCDLKPENILLDKNMTARVSDFGLAKLLPEDAEQLHNSSSVGVRGTVGYAAPEYGLGSSVSAAGDIYSYGVILLNMMTAIRPTDAMFEGELSLHKLAKSALPDSLMEIIDSRLELDYGEEPNDNPNSRRAIHEWAIGCITTIVQIGVKCCSELPRDRMDIKDVISQLQFETERLRLCRIQPRQHQTPRGT